LPSISDLREKISSGARQQDLLSTASELMIADRVEFSEDERDTTTSGFIGIDEVLHIFESALESVQLKDAVLLSSHQSETVSAQSNTDTERFSSSSGKTTKKSASGSSSTRRTSKRSQQPKEKSSSSKTRQKSSSQTKVSSRFRWSALITYLGYASSSVAVMSFLAALGGYYIKLSRQSVKSGRSSFRYAANLLQLKLATATSIGSECVGDFDHSSTGLLKCFLDHIYIFFCELKMRILLGLDLLWKLLTTCFEMLRKNRINTAEKLTIAPKELSLDCNSKVVAMVVPCQIPSSPTTIATNSPGTTPRLQMPFNSVEIVDITGNNNPGSK